MLVLQVLQGFDKGKKFVLPAGEPQLIGRSSEALPLNDSTVSRRHAELTPDGGTWFIRDLDSANGTFVNGNPISARVALAVGDQIRCGSTLFLLSQASDDGRRTSVIQMVDAETLDVTVHGRADPADESMILGAPDPVVAAKNHLRVIYDLTATTATVLQREKLLERVMDLIFGEFDPDRGFILLGAPLEAEVVRYRERPQTQDEGRIPVSRTIVQHALEQGVGILSTNAMDDKRFASGDSVQGYGIRSAICVPVVAGEHTLGVIHIDSQLANFTFTDEQLQLMNAIGRHTGLALRNLQLVRSRVQTERLAAMGQTVASLSHSIKNILQGLRGGADAVELALNRDDVELAREGWPILARNLDRIYTLTLNMLAYARQREPELELASIHDLVREVTELMQRECERKRVAIMLDLAEDMPPIPIDPAGMHQALVNLVSNAVEAAPPKRGVVTITTAYDGEAPAARVTVSDNGPGIDPAQHDAVFHAFTTTKGQRGTGLGLAVTRKIVEEHGGTIALESRPGQGSSFVVTIPTDRSVDAAETHLPKSMPAEREDWS